MKKELKEILETSTNEEIKELVESLNKAFFLRMFLAKNKADINDLKTYFDCDDDQANKMLKGAHEYSEDELNKFEKIKVYHKVRNTVEINNLLKKSRKHKK